VTFLTSSLKSWSPGVASPFATGSEAAWKAVLRHAVAVAPPTAVTARAVNIDFFVPGLVHGPPDLDNLCEPVLYVLVNEKGWCGGKRPQIGLLRATKQTSVTTGCRISLWSAPPGQIAPGSLCFEGSIPARSRGAPPTRIFLCGSCTRLGSR
jgi:hypothetical protein